MKVIKIGSAILSFTILAGCQSSPPKKAEKPMINEQEEPNPYGENPQQHNKYKAPDRGLGTLDYSRDAKEATDADTHQAEKAAQETDQ